MIRLGLLLTQRSLSLPLPLRKGRVGGNGVNLEKKRDKARKSMLWTFRDTPRFGGLTQQKPLHKWLGVWREGHHFRN